MYWTGKIFRDWHNNTNELICIVERTLESTICPKKEMFFENHT